jgi:hypothetical protein
MTDDILIDRIRAHRSAPDVYDPPTFEDMADRIMKLEKAYDAWANIAARYKENCEKSQAMLSTALVALNRIAQMDESNVTAYIQKVDAIALDALDEIGSKP